MTQPTKTLGRIDYSLWRTKSGAELRSGSGTDRIEIAKVCPHLVDGEALISAEAALELAAALIEAAALASGKTTQTSSDAVADLAGLVRQRQQAKSGGPVDVADPAAVHSLDKAITEAAAAAQPKAAEETATVEQFVPGPSSK